MQRNTTANLKKNKRKSGIEKDIDRSFEIINNYLPTKYANQIAKELGKEPSTIRAVRNRNHVDVGVIKALKDLALETKKLLNQ